MSEEEKNILKNLVIGESTELVSKIKGGTISYTVTGVPGGWLYRHIYNGEASVTYVPENY